MEQAAMFDVEFKTILDLYNKEINEKFMNIYEC